MARAIPLLNDYGDKCSYDTKDSKIKSWQHGDAVRNIIIIISSSSSIIIIIITIIIIVVILLLLLLSLSLALLLWGESIHRADTS